MFSLRPSMPFHLSRSLNCQSQQIVPEMAQIAFVREGTVKEESTERSSLNGSTAAYIAASPTELGCHGMREAPEKCVASRER